MKKVIMMMGIGFLLLTGCTKKEEGKQTIGVVQVVEHTSLNTIRDSFLDEMNVLGYDEDCFELQSAGGDESTLNTIVQKFVSDDKDCIVAIATPSAQVAAKYEDQVPVVFSAVSDPIGAGLLKDPSAPERNITGTSDEVQVDQILDLALQIQPDMKTIGVLYSSSEANSAAYVQQLEKLCEKKGLKLVKRSIIAVSDLQSAAQSLSADVEAIFVPNDNMIASSMPILVKIVKEKKIPVYAGADSMVQDGAFATVGIDYEELGRETARMVDQVLKGKEICNIPVKVFKDDLNIYINKDRLIELDITLPKSIRDNERLHMIGEK